MGVTHSGVKAHLYSTFAVSGKALASGKRLELLDLLAQGERSVDALARVARLNLTTASAHLQTLKQAGFVTTRRDGSRILYSLAGDDIAKLLALFLKAAERHQPAVAPALEDCFGADRGIEIDRAELQSRVAAGDVVVLDVRPAEEYAAGHIPGATSIPVDELPARIAELPADVDIVVYCRGEYCALAYDAVRALADHGRRALRLSDGMLEWRVADLPVDVEASA